MGCDCEDVMPLNGEIVCLQCGKVQCQVYNLDQNNTLSYNNNNQQKQTSSMSITDLYPVHHKDSILFETFYNQYTCLSKDVKETSWRWYCQARNLTDWEIHHNHSITSSGVMASSISCSILQRYGNQFTFWIKLISDYFHVKKSKLKKSVSILQSILSIDTMNSCHATHNDISQTILDHFCNVLQISTFDGAFKQNKSGLLQAAVMLCHRCVQVYMLPKRKTCQFVSDLAQIAQTELWQELKKLEG